MSQMSAHDKTEFWAAIVSRVTVWKVLPSKAVLRGGSSARAPVIAEAAPEGLLGKVATNCHSFAAGTLVAIHGAAQTPIEELRVGDPVDAYDQSTGEIESRPVTAVHLNDDPVTGTVVVDGETIATTPHHQFFTLERGWVDAEDLRSGDHVPSTDGSAGVVGDISWAGGPAMMYDLTVDVAHTYFVVEGEWLVHNCSNVPPAAADLAADVARKLGADLKPAKHGIGWRMEIPDVAGAVVRVMEQSAAGTNYWRVGIAGKGSLTLGNLISDVPGLTHHPITSISAAEILRLIAGRKP